MPPNGDTATGLILGEFINNGDTNINYGFKSLTLNINDGNLIHETGSLNLNNNNSYYIHYLLGDTEIINIGDYYKNNFEIGDPEYRNTAKRIYNTQYTIGDTTNTIIDFEKSNFDLKFTKDEINKHSIYAIGNSWALSYAKSPRIASRIFNGGYVNTLDSNSYNIRINVNEQGWRTIDITGDAGQSSSYTLETIADNINTDLTSAYDGDTYDTYDFAVIENNNRILIKSPTTTKNSALYFSTATPDAFAELFPNGSAFNHTTTGDFYLQYNADIDNMELVKLPGSNIPDLNFYLHYIWDRSLEKTTEDNFQAYLEDKKIISVNNIFREPRFFTFDITAEIFYSPSFVELVVKSDVEKALREEFSFINTAGRIKAEIGKNVFKSRIIKVITDVAGVENVNINYFGKDAQTDNTNEDLVINAEFNETAILSENILSSTNNILRGINILYTKLEIRD